MNADMPIVIYSFREPESHGGFNWFPDTPDMRERLVRLATQDTERDRLVLVLTMRDCGVAHPHVLTDFLDETLFFESGRVGHILFRSEGFKGDDDDE